MENEEIKELLKRYKEGACTPQENTKLEVWYDALAKSGEWDWTESEKIEIGNRIKAEVHEQINHHRTLRPYQPWLWAAASIVIFLIAGVMLYQHLKTPLITDPASYTETSVPPGQQIKLKLSDGSTVFLNGSSKLRYPKKFNAKDREVILAEGEAYFDIAHNAQKPFIVKTNTATIQVLGTAFNVRSYSSMEEILVTVARGKVSVKETLGAGANVNKQVLLLPDEQVSINKHSGTLQKSHIESETIISWTEGKLIFNNESLSNIAATLKYARNVTIRFAETDMTAIRCSAGFDSTDSVEDIVSALSRANGLSYTIKNKEVFLKKK